MTTAIEGFLEWLTRNEFDARVEDRASAAEYERWVLASWNEAWTASVGNAVVNESDA